MFNGPDCVQDRLTNAQEGTPFYAEAQATRYGSKPVYANSTEPLPPFTTIQACLPFNFAVAPGPPASYAITTVGEEDVLDAISYVVAADTLILSTDANFNTTGGIKLTVGPPPQLKPLKQLLLPSTARCFCFVRYRCSHWSAVL
jgi:hypothetical protein